MNKEKKTEIKVGITVLCAIIVFALIYGWAKNFSLSPENNLLRVKFNTVAGLEIGDLVTVNGVRKGLVNSISSKENFALTEIQFNEDVLLKEDATFSIMMLDLMGGKKIEIKPGDSNILLDFNKIQNGKFAGDISTAMATLSSVEGDLIEVINELKLSLKSANELFGSDNFSENISSALSEIKSLSENMNKLIEENRAIVKNTFENLNQISVSTNEFLENNNEKFTSILTKFDSTLTASNHLIKKFNSFSDEITNSENNLGKVLYDEELLSNLQESFKKIKELTKIINEQLKSGGLEVKADVDLF